jgi:hypothetical protein
VVWIEFVVVCFLIVQHIGSTSIKWSLVLISVFVVSVEGFKHWMWKWPWSGDDGQLPSPRGLDLGENGSLARSEDGNRTEVGEYGRKRTGLCRAEPLERSAKASDDST